MRRPLVLAALFLAACSPTSPSSDASDTPPDPTGATPTATVTSEPTAAPSAEPTATAGAPEGAKDACGGCPEGKRCEECPPNACQKAAKPGTMCPAVCGTPECVAK